MKDKVSECQVPTLIDTFLTYSHWWTSDNQRQFQPQACLESKYCAWFADCLKREPKEVSEGKARGAAQKNAPSKVRGSIAPPTVSTDAESRPSL